MTETESLLSAAIQAAHDIRSPLAALAVIEQDLASLPEDTRALLKAAVARLREIAADLLDRTRRSGAAPGFTTSRRAQASVQPLAPLLAALVDEKRLQYRAQAGLEIRFDPMTSELCARVMPADLQRMVSNLLDNAIEAGGGTGLVVIDLVGTEIGPVEIRIADRGCGMSAEVLSQAGRAGYSHGKARGNGLGLHHARKTVEAWGGALRIATEWGRGTTVTLELPLAL